MALPEVVEESNSMGARFYFRFAADESTTVSSGRNCINVVGILDWVSHKDIGGCLVAEWGIWSYINVASNIAKSQYDTVAQGF